MEAILENMGKMGVPEFNLHRPCRGYSIYLGCYEGALFLRKMLLLSLNLERTFFHLLSFSSEPSFQFDSERA